MNNNLNDANNYINQNNNVNMGINNGYMHGAAVNNGNYTNVNNTQNNVIDEQKKKNDRFLVFSIINGLIGLPMATTFFGLFFLFGVMITVGAYILISFFCFIIALVRSLVQLLTKK